MEEFDRTSFAAPSFTGIIEGPVKITCPRSLVARLNALAVSEDAFGAFKLPSRGTPQSGQSCAGVAVGTEAAAAAPSPVISAPQTSQ